jgi:hypothetical protein
MMLLPQVPQPRVVVGAKPFVRLPPAEVEQGWLMTRRLTVRARPAFRYFRRHRTVEGGAVAFAFQFQIGLGDGQGDLKGVVGVDGHDGAHFFFAERVGVPGAFGFGHDDAGAFRDAEACQFGDGFGLWPTTSLAVMPWSKMVSRSF